MIKKTFFIITVVFILTLSSFLYWFKSSNSSQIEDVEYNLEEGYTFMRVANDLERQNVITLPKLLIIYAKIMHLTGNLKVGTYFFPQGITPEQILFKLVKGDIVTIKVTVPEGLNIYQISEKLSIDFPKTNSKKWLELMCSRELINYLGSDLKIKCLEGFLFPQTYVFDPNLAPKQVLKSLINEFKKNVSQEMLAKAKQLGLTTLQYVTLASIVEKETAVPSERERIAGVYWNRLKINMMLQADPTVIYGIWDSYKGNLTKKDLLTPTPYNTYTKHGLPPGPIASPGLASLKATLYPVSQDLYFVAKGDGTHVFSRNLVEHNKAVSKYVYFLRENKKRDDKGMRNFYEVEGKSFLSLSKYMNEWENYLGIFAKDGSEKRSCTEFSFPCAKTLEPL